MAFWDIHHLKIRNCLVLDVRKSCWCFTFRRLQTLHSNCVSYSTQGINSSEQGNYSLGWLFSRNMDTIYIEKVYVVFGVTYPAFSVAVMDM